jgi:hypothetical protein
VGGKYQMPRTTRKPTCGSAMVQAVSRSW